MLSGSLPTYVKQERRNRRHKQRLLLMAQFQKWIPNCYAGNDRVVLAFACCINGVQMPPTAAEVAVWLWTLRIIPLRVQPVVAIIAMFIPRRVQPVLFRAAIHSGETGQHRTVRRDGR